MNWFQVSYLIALATLTYPAWGRQRYALTVMWGNLVAMLALAGAMDAGLLGRDMATVFMLIADLCSGVVLAMRQGVSRLIAWGYAITVPIYFLNLVGPAQIDTTFAVVYIAASAQIGVLAVGCDFGSGSGSVRRRFIGRFSVVSSRGDKTPSSAIVSSSFAGNRVAE